VSAAGKVAAFVGCAWSLGPDAGARVSLLWRQTKNLRVRLGLARHHPNERFTVRTRFGPLHFRDNFGDITNLTKLLYGREYALPRPPADGAVLDVGSNIGMAAVWFRSQLPGRPIHCFEPLVENTRMTALNCPEAAVHRVAVGAGPGTLSLDVDEDAVMASSIPWDHSAERRDVPVIALDDHVRAHGIERIAVLKIDAEGMELDVLRGAAETLRRTHQIVLETHGRARHDATVAALREAGFTVSRERFGAGTGLVFGAREPAGHPAVAAAG
jgi:FkbM family methyltransferase